MSTDLERRLTDAFRVDARRARLANPDRPTVGGHHRPVRGIGRPGRPWLVAAAAAAVLIVAGTALVLRTARDGGREEDPVDRPVLPAIPVPLWVDLPSDSTVALPRMPISAPAHRGSIWTGTELIVWGEPSAPDESPPPAGAAFNPRIGTWRTIAPAPTSRGTPVVWTGREMIVWGTAGADGAAYDPEADSWRLLADAPFSATDIAAAWTGNEVIVLGGYDDPAHAAAYDPATDQWRSLADPDGHLVTGPVWTGTTVLAVVDVIGPPLTGPNYHRRDNSRGLRLARYDLEADTWHIEDDANYAALVGIPDEDGVTRRVLAVPVRPGEPVDLLDAGGTPIGSLPAHPAEVGGSPTAAAGLWLGHEAVFSIDAVDDWLFPSPETWALDPVAGTWRRLTDDSLSPEEGVAFGDVLLATDGERGTAYRIRTSAGDD